MGRVSQRSIAHEGIAIPGTQVAKEVGQAMIAEGLRTRRTLSWIAADILTDWYEAVYLPAQNAKGKA